MKFKDVVQTILSSSSGSMTPQEISKQVKIDYPDFYGTPSHRRNVGKGHYKDLDHALLAQVYSLIGTSDIFCCDKSTKPMKISLSGADLQEHSSKATTEKEARHTSRGGKIFDYRDKIRAILSHAETYHDAYYKAETFRGPSLYFHERATQVEYRTCQPIELGWPKRLIP